MSGVDTNPYLFDAMRLIGAGAAVCEVAAPRADGTCSCWNGNDCRVPGKHPLGKAWMKAAIARRSRPTFRVPAIVRIAPSTSYGLIPTPGSGLMVIDRDDPAVALPMPDTLEVHRSSAPAGRGHYWFLLADGISEDEVPRAFAGGEVRIAASGHVVGPGSRHVSGDLYESNGAVIAYADRDLIEALRASEPLRRGSDGSVEAVMGSRHDWLVRQARKFAGWGWDADRIADRLRELNETVCLPPLDDREAEFGRMAEWAAKNIRPDRTTRVSKASRRAVRGWTP